MKRIKGICGMAIALLTGFCFMVTTVQGEEVSPSSLYAQGAVLMDAESGRVLFGKNEDMPLAMASTTKIMTCILTLETTDVNEEVKVSSYAASMPKVKLYIKQGESYVLNDLLHSLMLESHNDVAVAIAEHIGTKLLGGKISEDASEHTPEESKLAVLTFAKKMNEKASEIGCEDSYFVTPNGLDGSYKDMEHHSTAADMARIMAYCVIDSEKKEEFLTITQTPSHSFTANGRSFSCYNHNTFLSMMDGVLSGKTGFTNKAGYCYVGALESEGRTYTIALLACGWPNNKTYKWADARELFTYGIEEFDYISSEMVKVRELIPEKLKVLNGQSPAIGEEAKVHLTIVNEDEQVQVLGKDSEVFLAEVSLPKSLQAPVRKGEKIGSVTYLLGGDVFLVKDIVLARSVAAVDYSWCVDKVFDVFCLF